MTNSAITVVLNYALILGLAIIQGCATTMETSELPQNMRFGPAGEDGYRRLINITYSHPMPQMAKSEYLDRMIECVDESVDFEKIVLGDGSIMRVRKHTDTSYTGGNRDRIESSDVLTGANSYKTTVNAAGVTTYPAALGTTAIARFSLTVKPGENNDYILQFHNIYIALKELLAEKGFTRLGNNPYQHPEILHEKTRIMSEAINACLTVGKITGQRSSSGNYESSVIVNELLTKAMQFDSYAQDYIVQGNTVKRMYFQFSKNGRPFYRFRSEYLRNGSPYVHLVNVDGEHDYHYYPDLAVAYRVGTEGDRDESSYMAKKTWHFDYEGAYVIGEDMINGKECYLLRKGKHTMCVWKKHGLQLDLRGNGGTLYYDNFDLQVPDDLFVLPDGVTITDR